MRQQGERNSIPAVDEEQQPGTGVRTETSMMPHRAATVKWFKPVESAARARPRAAKSGTEFGWIFCLLHGSTNYRCCQQIRYEAKLRGQQAGGVDDGDDAALL